MAFKYIAQLSMISPDIFYEVDYEPDHDYEWDGDGPDPVDEGFSCFSVTVSAQAIVGGSMIRGGEHLGGTYVEDRNTIRGKPVGGDVDGYLNQMLVAALDDLCEQPIEGSARRIGESTYRDICKQANRAKKWLREQR